MVIAEIPLLDVHFQLWVLLVTGFILLWFLYVWGISGVGSGYSAEGRPRL
jgi:hypothetical protein